MRVDSSHQHSDPDAEDSSDVTNESFEPLHNSRAINNKSTSVVNERVNDERKNSTPSSKFFQTYCKLKKKLMSFNCFVISK